MIVSSFGGNILKLFIQCAFKIFRRMCRKSHGSESGQKLKMILVLCQLNTDELAWASLCLGHERAPPIYNRILGGTVLSFLWVIPWCILFIGWAYILHVPTTCQLGMWVFWVIMLKIIPLFFFYHLHYSKTFSHINSFNPCTTLWSRYNY